MTTCGLCKTPTRHVGSHVLRVHVPAGANPKTTHAILVEERTARRAAADRWYDRGCRPFPCRDYHGTYAHTSGEDPCACPCHERGIPVTAEPGSLAGRLLGLDEPADVPPGLTSADMRDLERDTH